MARSRSTRLRCIATGYLNEGTTEYRLTDEIGATKVTVLLPPGYMELGETYSVTINHEPEPEQDG